MEKRMTIYLFGVVSSVLLLLGVDRSIAESLYSQVNRNVIRLEHYEQVKFEESSAIITRNIPDGTGFFIGVLGVDNTLFVVTARHVAELPYDLHARVHCINVNTGKHENILLRLKRSRWIYHPSTGDESTRAVDVAVMRLSFPRDREVIAFKYDQNNIMAGNIPKEDPEPPQPVLVFGFPGDIGFELKEQRPVGRFGIISMVAGDKFLKYSDGKYFDKKAYLVDLSVFPGNSGSPVINQVFPILDERIKLLGLVSASNIGIKYAVVEPVSRILEAIEKAKHQPLDQETWFSTE